MASKDVTRFIGIVRFVLPLVLIFFIAAGSADACPKHKSKAPHRTKSLNTRTVSYMTPVVITYGGQRCADNHYGTPRVKYVSTRDDGHYESATRYVAVLRSVPRTRYVAVRENFDDGPQYVASRRKPVYVASSTRYVAVRNYSPQPRLIEVRHFDDGYVKPTYVAVQRIPVVDDYFEPRKNRVVALRNSACDCSRAVSMTSSFDDDVETAAPTRVIFRDEVPYTSSVRHIVVKTDDIDGTEEVIYSGSKHTDSAYVDMLDASFPVSNGVSYNEMDDVDLDHNAEMYNEAAYVAENNSEAACLPEAFVQTSPDGAMTRTVSYAPAIANDEYDLIGGGDAAFVADDDDVAPPLRYVSSVDDSGLIDADTVTVVNGVVANCLGISAARYCDEVLAFDEVSYVRGGENGYDTTSVQYIPVENVVYVAVDDIDSVEMSDIDVNSCDPIVSSIDGEPDSFVYESSVDFDENDAAIVEDLGNSREPEYITEV